MTSEDDERCWQELIKDVRRLPHDKPPLSGRKTELRVVPKISPDRVYRGAALADIVKGISDAIGVVNGEAQSYYQYVKTEWKNFYDDVKNQSVSGSEDFLQKMDTSFKNEFQTLCKAF